jgi:P-type Cu+ transporter
VVEVGVATAEVVGEAVAARVEVEVATGLVGRRLEPCLRSTPFTNREGLGVEAVLDGDRLVLAGREQLLREWDFEIPAELDAVRERAARRGHTAVLVGWDGRAPSTRSCAQIDRRMHARNVSGTHARLPEHRRQMGGRL